MRILLIGPFGLGFLADSYARAFERLGHEVVRFDSDRACLQSARWSGNRFLRRLLRRSLWKRVNETTLQTFRDVRPELAVVFKGSFLDPETVRQVRSREGVPVLNYYPDNPYCGVPLDPRKTSALRRDLIEVLREYTRVLTWDAALVNRLRLDGVSAAYLPFGADTDLYRPLEAGNCSTRFAAVFVGQHSAMRAKHVDAIRRHEVALWGPRWGRARRRFSKRHVIHPQRVFGGDCAHIYARAEVCLNIVDDLNVPGHNMRTFEIPACGAVMLSRYTPEQSGFFPEGEAACYYRSPSELDDLLAGLLSDGPLRERMRRNALRIAREHDYTRRAGEMLKALS